MRSRSSSVRCNAAKLAPLGSRASRVSMTAWKGIPRPRISSWMGRVMIVGRGLCTTAPPFRPGRVVMRSSASRRLSASRTEVRLIPVFSTSSRSEGRGSPSRSSSLRIFSRNMAASTPDFFGVWMSSISNVGFSGFMMVSSWPVVIRGSIWSNNLLDGGYHWSYIYASDSFGSYATRLKRSRKVSISMDTGADRSRANGPGSLEVRDVSKRFGEVEVVRPTSLSIESGQFVTLLGPSGSGKTTLLKMIAGFEHPTTGSILIGSRDVTRLAPQKRNVGFVFQQYALFPHLTVAGNLAYPLEMRSTSKRQID